MTIGKLIRLCYTEAAKHKGLSKDIRDCPELLSALVAAIAPANMAGAKAKEGHDKARQGEALGICLGCNKKFPVGHLIHGAWCHKCY